MPVGSKEIVIGDWNYQHFIDPHIDGEKKKCGTIPRDWKAYPHGSLMHAKPFDLPLIPESEWQSRLDAQIKAKSQLSDVRNQGYNGKPIPSRDQNGKGYCLPPSTKIRMADGSHKPIDKMCLGDTVLSAEGNIREVQQLHVREYDGDLINVKMWGHSHLRLTPNHSVLTKRGYVRADSLTVDDYVAVPRFAPQTAKVVQTSEHILGVKRRVKNRAGKASFEYRIPSSKEGSANHVPDFIDLTRGCGRIFGLWLAEGHLDDSDSSSSKRVVWSFGTVGKMHLVDELVGLLESEWGLTADVGFGPSSDSVTQVTIRGTMWCQLFQSLCGRLAGGKKVHGDLMSGPKEFLEGLFTAHREADGERTISASMAMNMYDIANYLGLRPGILREAPQITGWCKTRQAVWRININENPSNALPCGYDYRTKEDAGYMWRRIRCTEREKYAGKVYNIGVAVDNSYVAESVGVHNCWAHSSTSAAMIVRAIMNEPYADLSAYMVACIIKGYADEGGWGSESLEFIAQNGIPDSKFWPQQSMDRSNDNAAMRADAAKHKYTDWRDLDPSNMKAQLVTCLLMGFPVVTDFNWWSHSVCTIDLVSLSPFRTRIWNSWGDSWSENGTGVLEGDKAMPDSALCAIVMTPSPA